MPPPLPEELLPPDELGEPPEPEDELEPPLEVLFEEPSSLESPKALPPPPSLQAIREASRHPPSNSRAQLDRCSIFVAAGFISSSFFEKKRDIDRR
jgi:hypothetical protein